jgi:RNA polymerase sigma-70 factor (ECF subfamily)
MTTAGVVERLFRHSTGPVLATLTRALGPERLDLAEDCLADALELALRVWPVSGVPANPRGWLFRVARNRALDVVRREKTLRAKLPLLAEDAPEADDGELALMFLCCHPALPRASQVALTLKIVGGLGVREIATALLAKESAVSQRLVRAKKWFRESGEAVEVPEALEARLDGVLDVLYLLFNEGYQATTGELVVRRELCAEAIRLTRLLTADSRTDLPRVRALLALQLLQASRLPARDELLLIDEQDQSKWDTALVREGTEVFERSCTGPELSAFHVEAAIALCHTVSPPDWRRILALYDDLLVVRPSAVVRLNRAIALAAVDGPRVGIAELDRLSGEPLLAGHLPLPAALGALHLRAGDPADAARHYREALRLPCSEPQRRFLEQRLAGCG